MLAKGFEASEDLTKELQAFVKKETAPYKYPRIVEYVDELPKTVGGKIKRKLIRSLDGVVDDETKVHSPAGDHHNPDDSY